MLLYQNRNNHLNRGSPWTIPWQPNSTKFLQQYCCTIKVCNSFVLKTVFFLVNSVLHPISRTSSYGCNNHISLPNKYPSLSINLKVSHPRCVVKIQEREEYPICVQSQNTTKHKTKFITLLQHYNLYNIVPNNRDIMIVQVARSKLNKE